MVALLQRARVADRTGARVDLIQKRENLTGKVADRIVRVPLPDLASISPKFHRQ